MTHRLRNNQSMMSLIRDHSLEREDSQEEPLGARPQTRQYKKTD